MCHGCGKSTTATAAGSNAHMGYYSVAASKATASTVKASAGVQWRASIWSQRGRMHPMTASMVIIVLILGTCRERRMSVVGCCNEGVQFLRWFLKVNCML
jgi:hypothetical protein